jgi:hypothetical protein
MLYMVEMDFTQPARRLQWDAWYAQHLQVLLSVPGFHTAQRFLCAMPHPAPYLAIYSVDSADIFESDAYRSRGGRDSTGAWKATMVHWDRNLFAGLERAPAVSADELLLVTEDAGAAAAHADIAFSWLDAVGLDRTVQRRALAVVKKQHRAMPEPIRAYAPLMPQRLRGEA